MEWVESNALELVAVLVALGAAAVSAWAGLHTKRANAIATAVAWAIKIEHTDPYKDPPARTTFHLTNAGVVAARDVRVVFGFDPGGVAHGDHEWAVIPAGATETIEVPMMGLSGWMNVINRARLDRTLRQMTIRWSPPHGSAQSQTKDLLL